jgi:hypothetical protein
MERPWERTPLRIDKDAKLRGRAYRTRPSERAHWQRLHVRVCGRVWSCLDLARELLCLAGVLQPEQPRLVPPSQPRADDLEQLPTTTPREWPRGCTHRRHGQHRIRHAVGIAYDMQSASHTTCGQHHIRQHRIGHGGRARRTCAQHRRRASRVGGSAWAPC